MWPASVVLDRDQPNHLVDEPGVVAGRGRHLLDRRAGAQRLGHREDPARQRSSQD